MVEGFDIECDPAGVEVKVERREGDGGAAGDEVARRLGRNDAVLVPLRARGVDRPFGKPATSEAGPPEPTYREACRSERSPPLPQPS